MAVVGQVTHVRCKIMYRCVCTRHCAVETDTQQRYQQRVLKKQTWDPTLSSTTHVTVARRQACNHTIPRQQGSLRLTHLLFSRFTWSRNHGRVNSSHAADSVTFAERVRNSKSRPPSIIQRSCERCSQTLCTFINRFVTKSVIPFVRTSRFTLLKFFLPTTHFTICLFARRPRFFVEGRTVTDLSFASVQHVLFCSNSHCASCRMFCRIASDFHMACSVKQSAM